MVDSQGLILMMPPAQTLKSIQIMADHSQNWYNEATTWQRNMNIHAIQVVHPTKERSLKEDDKVGEQVKYIGFLEETINRFIEESIKKQSEMDELIKKLWDDLDMKLRMIDAATMNLQGKSEKLTQEILTSSMADE
ncbi:hypothetical protein Tco_0323996 [Tanacetum coccineum]